MQSLAEHHNDTQFLLHMAKRIAHDHPTVVKNKALCPVLFSLSPIAFEWLNQNVSDYSLLNGNRNSQIKKFPVCKVSGYASGGLADAL
jgi:hypothetical protein